LNLIQQLRSDGLNVENAPGILFLGNNKTSISFNLCNRKAKVFNVVNPEQFLLEA
jgi:hypothetical protein